MARVPIRLSRFAAAAELRAFDAIRWPERRSRRPEGMDDVDRQARRWPWSSRRDKDNARERVIRPVVAHAEALLAKRGRDPLPAGVTAHKLRHTFASILFVRGEDPPYVMAQLGHTDPAFTLRVYAHAMRRDDGDKERLSALVEGRDWAPMGTGATSEPLQDRGASTPRKRRSPRNPRTSDDGRGGFRTCDLSRVKTARLAAAYCRASPVWLSRPVPATGEKARAARFCPSPLLGALRRLPPTHRPRITLLRLQA